MIPIKRAILSVSDKRGIVNLAKELSEFGVDIISTGQTFHLLKTHGIAARHVSELTGFPEILGGRVKTLHPKILGALLGIPDNPVHQKDMTQFAIESIDLVVVNLYPFEEVTMRPDAAIDEAMEQIDIGGPTLIRAAAKNFQYKTVLVNPDQYPAFLNELRKHQGKVSSEMRLTLAREAFLHTAKYDQVIFQYFDKYINRDAKSALPSVLNLAAGKELDLRYGENPHQKGALYGHFGKIFKKLHGKELSYNNIADIHAAALLINEFDTPAVAIIKHTNPCGVATAENLLDAYHAAFATDPVSAFGGIVVVNQPLDLETAEAIDEVFTEVVIAPDFQPDALEFLKRKKGRRLIQQSSDPRFLYEFDVKSVIGGFLLQEPDHQRIGQEDLRVVTKRAPTEDEFSALLFAWRVAKHVKSNAIVFALSDRTVGIGAGQMSRVDSARVAVMKAHQSGLDLRGTVVASDAFFPFADGLVECVRAGATAVIQPGGSIRDEEVIRAADEHNTAMIFTGIRHFHH
ncbi:MAG: bifunctional phosphoribosylaminoimidazolecarboxamide formyltransferase/IMP cyclohydrolase [Bacteroidota bacterium]